MTERAQAANGFDDALSDFIARAEKIDGRKLVIDGGTSQFVYLATEKFFEPTDDGSMPWKLTSEREGAVTLCRYHCDVRRRDGEISRQVRHPLLRGAGPRLFGLPDYGRTIFEPFPITTKKTVKK